MSFACPHFDWDKDHCVLLDAACVPGRAGCVLRNNSVFYVPVEERLQKVQRPSPPKVPARAPNATKPRRRGSQS